MKTELETLRGLYDRIEQIYVEIDPYGEVAAYDVEQTAHILLDLLNMMVQKAERKQQIRDLRGQTVSEQVDRLDETAHLSVRIQRATDGHVVVLIKHGPEVVILPADALDELIPMLQEMATYAKERGP